MQIIGGRALPLDYAVTFLQIIFIILEIIFSSRAAAYITKKTGNSFYLRNSFTTIYNKNDNPIKSSNEIEQELYFHFPHLANLGKSYDSKTGKFIKFDVNTEKKIYNSVNKIN